MHQVPDTSPTTIEPVDALKGLRHALEAPPEARLERFEHSVMTPLEPFWKPFIGMMQSGSGDGPLDVAQAFGLFSPSDDVSAGLEALDRMDAAGSWESCKEALRRATAALDPDGHGFPLGRVLFTLVLSNPSSLHPKAGLYAGNSARPGLLMVNAWPTKYNLPRLAAAAAHELNHQVRFRFEPFNPQLVTVGQYLVAEGLAETFAAELYGESRIGPWATDWDESALDKLRPLYSGALDVSGFDEVRGYIFGDWAAERFGYTPVGVPDFAGYAVGYRLVRDFLERTGKTAADATYLAWEEITEGSGYL